MKPPFNDGDTTMQYTRKASITLWIVQGLLAALFLFTGVMKLVLPLEMLKGPVPLPGLFVRFIGVAEVAGGLGLILPGLLHIRQSLTPLAAVGLVTIMTGATVVTLEGGVVAPALVPLVVGLLATFVAFGRRQWGPPTLSISLPAIRRTSRAWSSPPSRGIQRQAHGASQCDSWRFTRRWRTAPPRRRKKSPRWGTSSRR
jgi:hypothetical protein